MEFIVALILIWRIRASLSDEADIARWYKPLTYGLVACGVLLVMKSGSSISTLVQWIGYIILLALFYGIYKVPAFGSVRNIMVSILPYTLVAILAALVKLISLKLYDRYETILDMAEAFAFIWLVGSFIVFHRQRKALERERKLREMEAIQNKITTQRKAELEVLVQERTRELSEQNQTLQQTLRDLSAAQAQLIHSEKMASLGQLMAGIAHEIKNPLNFVNNFSDLNTELTEELMFALEKDDKHEALEIAETIRENEQKIAHHGKRADSIVRSMLQHSRSGSGKRELVDLNNMADECLRLSYHGMRARERSFNAKMETHFDPAMGEVELIPEEMNRVLINICTNALYTVYERAKQEAGTDYQPTVIVQTRAEADRWVIEIKDNGTGIPADVIDKVFQPFFTTKPTGEGTGLGLSMSYDIITKGHNGQLYVSSEPGKGSTFTITLPRTKTINPEKT
ncbi:MAG TPA: ATP-binding protein [Phnomibacter sp.]|nr:ATP-binding protein [Phnomibacter sp.]